LSSGGSVWTEADLVLADEPQNGNVPDRQEPLTCAKLAIALEAPRRAMAKLLS
jgi:hypothetical protein